MMLNFGQNRVVVKSCFRPTQAQTRFVRSFLPSLGFVLSRLSLARPPSLLVDTVPCSYRGFEQPRLLSDTRLCPSRLSIAARVAAFQVYKAHI